MNFLIATSRASSGQSGLLRKAVDPLRILRKLAGGVSLSSSNPFN
jgi:hypothetical protein